LAYDFFAVDTVLFGGLYGRVFFGPLIALP
jgi:hypothetical protein